ncbi:AAA family ATPase [Fibrobacter sp.]
MAYYPESNVPKKQKSRGGCLCLIVFLFFFYIVSKFFSKAESSFEILFGIIVFCLIVGFIYYIAKRIKNNEKEDDFLNDSPSMSRNSNNVDWTDYKRNFQKQLEENRVEKVSKKSDNTKINTNSKNENKEWKNIDKIGEESNDCIRDVSIDDVHTPPNEQIHPNISKYLKKFTPITIAIETFFKELLKKSEYELELKKHISEDSNIYSMEQLYASIILTDLMICSEKLGHEVSIDTEETCGFISLFFKLGILPLNNNQTIETNVIKFYQIEDKGVFTIFLRSLEHLRSQIQAFDAEFVFPTLFQNNKELVSKYYGILYNFSSILANIDNRLTQDEVQFLQVLEIKKNIKPNNIKIVKQNDDSEQAENKISKKTKYKSPKSTEEKHDAEKELNELIGLFSVKKEIETFKNFLNIRKERDKKGLPVPPTSYHLVFSGNPGTGKTTIARIVAQIFQELGILSKGHLIEASRSDLVAGYVGQTALKTNKIIDDALDGVLFIDEAYTLSNGSDNDFGQEAIDTLLKRMEDDRNRLVVIVAGYTEEIKTFINSNPGLSSRFNRYIEFPDYNTEELLEIFKKLISKYRYVLDEAAEKTLKQKINNAVKNKDKFFGNGRYVRNLFEKCIEKQANRLASESSLADADICKLTPEDFD